MSDFPSSEPALSRQTVDTGSALCEALFSARQRRTSTGGTRRRLHSPPSRAIGRSRVPTVPDRCLNFGTLAHAWPQTTVQPTAAPLFKHACWRVTPIRCIVADIRELPRAVNASAG